MNDHKTYLGDAVYVALDPHLPGALVLTTENGIAATNTIVLETEVLSNLFLYIAKLKEPQPEAA